MIGVFMILTVAALIGVVLKPNLWTAAALAFTAGFLFGEIFAEVLT